MQPHAPTLGVPIDCQACPGTLNGSNSLLRSSVLEVITSSAGSELQHLIMPSMHKEVFPFVCSAPIAHRNVSIVMIIHPTQPLPLHFLGERKDGQISNWLPFQAF